MLFPSLLRATRKLLERRRAPARPRPGVRPRLEAIEERLLLANCVWNTNDSGLWNDASKWNACNGGTPGPADTATINRAGVEVTFEEEGGAIDVSTLTVSGVGTHLRFTGQDLAVRTGVITAGATLTLNTAGALRVLLGFDFNSATFNFNQGNIEGTPANFRVEMVNSTLNLGEAAGTGVIYLFRPNNTLCGHVPAGLTIAVAFRTGDGQARVTLCDGQDELRNAGRIELIGTQLGAAHVTAPVLANGPGGEIVFRGNQSNNLAVGQVVNELAGTVTSAGGLITGSFRNDGDVFLTANRLSVGVSFRNTLTGLVQGVGTVETPATLINEGVLEVPGGGSLTVNNGVETSGVVIINPIGTLATPGYVQRDGLTVVGGGTLRVGGGNGVFDVFGGEVHAYGTIHAGLFRNRGRLEVGGPGSVGTLVIQGNYLQTAAGSLAFDVGGTLPIVDSDYLAITGTADLAGTILVRLVNDYQPLSGDILEIIRAGGGIVRDLTQLEGDWPGYGFSFQNWYYLYFE